GQHPVDPGFIFDRMLGRLERAELVDVGPRCEGLIAGALEHEHLDRTVPVGLLADLGKTLVHLEGEGIAGLRPVERGAPDAVPHLEKEFIGDRGLLIHAIRLRISCYCRDRFERKESVSAIQADDRGWVKVHGTSRSRRLTIAPTALGLRRWLFARPVPKWVLQAVPHRFEYRPALLHGVIGAIELARHAAFPRTIAKLKERLVLGASRLHIGRQSG